MTTSTSPQFAPESMIGSLVAARPALARVFENLGLDYCCGGKQTLATACAGKGLDAQTVVAMLEAAVVAPTTEMDPAGMTLTQLADHIEQTHHVYVKAELPRLVELAERVAHKHAWRDARLPEVAETVVALANEMASHMQKEEMILFPLIRLIDAGETSGFHCGSIANPISVMEAEHESAGSATARLRELTDGFTPDAEACNTHRALLASLAEFESDLHRHVHKENNILFPRALAKEKQ
ncbi:MAG: iron-sulfur cluster repair di-iron protein [Cephaloticoccus sp.]|nr:iron-sulfur cluster repair di-iron protein [Cephaloticoccus sp.]MCF7759829.1 iron-sulfur cluster repair di-iron protein [Cephaloticoccus sp.]